MNKVNHKVTYMERESNIPNISFLLTDKHSRLPTKADEGSAGYDLFSIDETIIDPGSWQLVSTGLIWEPDSYDIEMQIRPRSGMAYKHGVTVLNSPGTIDASYRGIIGVLLINHSDEPYKIKIGDRIAQAIISPVAEAELSIVTKVSETKRKGGFGSTGK